MSIRHLDQLLAPRSVVVVGASNRPGSVGATVWRNLRAGSFTGPVFGVNPKHATLDGVKLVRRVADLADLPEAPDLAVLCTPPDTVPELVAELGRLGTRAAIVMTAGLSAKQKQSALDAARLHLLRLLGPNCLGLPSPRIGLNASFAHVDALPGEIAFVSQSGALVTVVLDWARSRRIGFSHMVSLGERADVDFGDLLDYFASDPHTRSILLYIESIESPRKFMSAARSAARNKPVIVVKAGRAGNGLQAAASHTGALAGSDVVFDAAIRRAGMLRVDTLHELFMAAQTLARFRGNHRPGLTLMTNGGGAGVMAADAAAMTGVDLPPLGEAVRRKLDDLLPPTWSHGNPIDIIGDAPVERYTGTLRTLLDDPDAGTVLFMHAPTAIVRSEDIARACAPLAREAAGRLMACWLGDAGVAEARRIFEEAGVAGYDTPAEAVHAFAMLASYQRNQMLLVRPIRPEDAARHLAFAMQLAPEDVRLRFFSTRRELPRSELVRLCRSTTTAKWHSSRLTYNPTPRCERSASCAQWPTQTTSRQSSRSSGRPRSGQGLGQRLLDKMIRHFQGHGTQRLAAEVLGENNAMCGLAKQSGFTLDAARSDNAQMRYVFELKPAPTRAG
jgi:acetyltransferase